MFRFREGAADGDPFGVVGQWPSETPEEWWDHAWWTEEAHADLPPGWKSVWSEDEGYYYFLHAVTEEQTWAKPRADLPVGWTSVSSPENGEGYYLNLDTGEQSWTKPQAGGVQPDAQFAGLPQQPPMQSLRQQFFMPTSTEEQETPAVPGPSMAPLISPLWDQYDVVTDLTDSVPLINRRLLSSRTLVQARLTRKDPELFFSSTMYDQNLASKALEESAKYPIPEPEDKEEPTFNSLLSPSEFSSFTKTAPATKPDFSEQSQATRSDFSDFSIVG